MYLFRKIAEILVLFIIFFGFGDIYANDCWPDSSIEPHTVSLYEDGEDVVFVVENLPCPLPNREDDGDPDFLVYIIFGDGSYDTREVFLTFDGENPEPVEKVVFIHRFNGTSPSDYLTNIEDNSSDISFPRVGVVKLYTPPSEDGMDETDSFTVPGGTLPFDIVPVRSNFYNGDHYFGIVPDMSASETVIFTPIIDPVPTNYFPILLTYKHPGSGTCGDFTADLKVEFNSAGDYFEFGKPSGVSGPEGFQIYNEETQLDSDNISFSFHFENLSVSTGTQHMLFYLTTKESSSEGDEYSLEASFINSTCSSSPSGIVGSRTGLISSAHDPNAVVTLDTFLIDKAHVNIDEGRDTLFYRIQFENTGSQNNVGVRIGINLDPRLEYICTKYSIARGKLVNCNPWNTFFTCVWPINRGVPYDFLHSRNNGPVEDASEGVPFGREDYYVCACGNDNDEQVELFETILKRSPVNLSSPADESIVDASGLEDEDRLPEDSNQGSIFLSMEDNQGEIMVLCRLKKGAIIPDDGEFRSEFYTTFISPDLHTITLKDTTPFQARNFPMVDGTRQAQRYVFNECRQEVPDFVPIFFNILMILIFILIPFIFIPKLRAWSFGLFKPKFSSSGDDISGFKK